MRYVSLIFILCTWMYGHTAIAVPSGTNCTVIGEKCTETGSKKIMDFTVNKPCWKKEKVYKCDSPQQRYAPDKQVCKNGKVTVAGGK